MYNFPVKIDGCKELKRVFPTMQASVQKIVDIAKTLPEIKRIIVFGSAVTPNCGIGSDIDVAFDMPTISEDKYYSYLKPIRFNIDIPYDFIHYNSVTNPILINEINNKGVEIWLT